MGVDFKYPVGRANGTITKSNVRLADLKAIIYAVVAQLEEHETFNFGALGSSPSNRTSQEQCPRLSCIGLERLNKGFLNMVRNIFI